MSAPCVFLFTLDLVSSSSRQFWTMISWKIWTWTRSVKSSIACIRFNMRLKVSSSKRAMLVASSTSWKVSLWFYHIFFVKCDFYDFVYFDTLKCNGVTHAVMFIISSFVIIRCSRFLFHFTMSNGNFRDNWKFHANSWSALHLAVNIRFPFYDRKTHVRVSEEQTEKQQ